MLLARKDGVYEIPWVDAHYDELAKCAFERCLAERLDVNGRCDALIWVRELRRPGETGTFAIELVFAAKLSGLERPCTALGDENGLVWIERDRVNEVATNPAKMGRALSIEKFNLQHGLSHATRIHAGAMEWR